MREGQGGVKADLGSMRLTAGYSKDHIYPLEVYKPLQSLLLQSLETDVRVRGDCYIYWVSKMK